MLLKIVFHFCSLNGIHHLSSTSQVDTRWWCLLKSCSTYCSSMSLYRSIDSDSTLLSQQSLPTRKLSMFYSTNTHIYWYNDFKLIHSDMMIIDDQSYVHHHQIEQFTYTTWFQSIERERFNRWICLPQNEYIRAFDFIRLYMVRGVI